MKSVTAVVGAVSLLACTSATAYAVPTEHRVPSRAPSLCAAKPHPKPTAITFCNPLNRSRGVGAGRGLL
jgi:hypothetical protein